MPQPHPGNGRVFPERWHRIVREAMRIRGRRTAGAMYRGNPLGRRRDAGAYVAMAIEDKLGMPRGVP
jgi:hypothetical protein